MPCTLGVQIWMVAAAQLAVSFFFNLGPTPGIVLTVFSVSLHTSANPV